MSVSLSRSSAGKNIKKGAVSFTSRRDEKIASSKLAAKRIKKIKPVKKKKKSKVPNLYWRFAIAGFLIPLLIGGIAFSLNKLKGLVTEVEQKRGQMVAYSEREASFKNLSLDLDSVKEEIALLENGLPNEEGVIDFLEKVVELEKKNEVEIKALGFSNDLPRLDKNENNYIELIVEASGSVVNLEKFLGNFLNLPILVKTKTVDVSKMDEEPSKMVFRAWLYVDPDFFLK